MTEKKRNGITHKVIPFPVKTYSQCLTKKPKKNETETY
jgi:hypothetical protein